ncbi:MAG TPA: hypothetical protein VJQ79_00330 [Acidimicrobiia bacterium]|nr:hypothetical protein [Acidimicrobiia bacterium]
MADRLRVILEVGKKERRVVAGAMDWPGLDRWGKTADVAIEKLTSYLPRYAAVAKLAGLAKEFALHRDVEIVERVTGSGSADYWGIAHLPSAIEREVLPSPELERRLSLLEACWSYFDATAARVSADLQPGPRGGGWTRDELIRHVHINEAEQFTRKVEVRTPREFMLIPDQREVHRTATLDAIRAYNAEGKTARSWPIQFLIRRVAHHVMDHAWEMEDRDGRS